MLPNETGEIGICLANLTHNGSHNSNYKDLLWYEQSGGLFMFLQVSSCCLVICLKCVARGILIQASKSLNLKVVVFTFVSTNAKMIWRKTLSSSLLFDLSLYQLLLFLNFFNFNSSLRRPFLEGYCSLYFCSINAKMIWRLQVYYLTLSTSSISRTKRQKWDICNVLVIVRTYFTHYDHVFCCQFCSRLLWLFTWEYSDDSSCLTFWLECIYIRNYASARVVISSINNVEPWALSSTYRQAVVKSYPNRIKCFPYQNPKPKSICRFAEKDEVEDELLAFLWAPFLFVGQSLCITFYLSFCRK